MTADNGYFLYYDKNYFTEEDVKSLDRILEVAGAAGKKFSMEFSSGWYSYAFFGNTGLEFGINDDGCECIFRTAGMGINTFMDKLQDILKMKMQNLSAVKLRLLQPNQMRLILFLWK